MEHMQKENAKIKEEIKALHLRQNDFSARQPYKKSNSQYKKSKSVVKKLYFYNDL